MTLKCYRCGSDLGKLTLPLARLDVCPDCSIELHVCKMCIHYAPAVAGGCTEDDAEEIHEKARANFCDYFSPSSDAFDGSLDAADRQARTELDALFGAGQTGSKQEPASARDRNEDAAADDTLEQANALFKD